MHTFVTMDNRVQRNTAHVFAGTQLHYYAVTIIMHVNKSATEEEHSSTQINS